MRGMRPEPAYTIAGMHRGGGREKKPEQEGGFLLRRACGVEGLMHPSLLPDIG
jgi:hypothetical protein